MQAVPKQMRAHPSHVRGVHPIPTQASFACRGAPIADVLRRRAASAFDERSVVLDRQLRLEGAQLHDRRDCCMPASCIDALGCAVVPESQSMLRSNDCQYLNVG